MGATVKGAYFASGAVKHPVQREAREKKISNSVNVSMCCGTEVVLIDCGSQHRKDCSLCGKFLGFVAK